MGQFQELYNLISPMLNDLSTFLQAIALIVAGVMAVMYKVREMFADVQEDQMYSQKTKKVFFALAFVFIIPTVVKIVSGYLQ